MERASFRVTPSLGEDEGRKRGKDGEFRGVVCYGGSFKCFTGRESC